MGEEFLVVPCKQLLLPIVALSIDLLPIETQFAGLDQYVSSVTAEQSIKFKETRAGLAKPAVRVGGGGDVGLWIMRWKREEMEEKDDDEGEEERRRRRRRMSSVELCVGFLNVFARVWFAMLCYALRCYFMLHCTMLCFANHAVIRYAILYCAMLFSDWGKECLAVKILHACVYRSCKVVDTKTKRKKRRREEVIRRLQ